jgi:hypothetical protein
MLQVDTAVRFLANPRVAAAPEELRRTFLSKKGLTEEEIGLALARSAVTRPGPPAQPGPVVAQPGPSGAAYPLATQYPPYVAPSSSVMLFFKLVLRIRDVYPGSRIQSVTSTGSRICNITLKG